VSNCADLCADRVDLSLGSGGSAPVVMGDFGVLPRPKRLKPCLEAMKLSVPMHRLCGRYGTDSQQSNDRSRGGDETR
jgi:hypothetical protein